MSDKTKERPEAVPPYYSSNGGVKTLTVKATGCTLFGVDVLVKTSQRMFNGIKGASYCATQSIKLEWKDTNTIKSYELD
jgi:hypothetical protein